MSPDGELSTSISRPTSWVKSFALLSLTLICVYFTGRILTPLLPPIVWAIALAVITRPVFLRVRELLHSSSIAASIVVLGLGITIVAPSAWVSKELITAGIEGFNSIIPSSAQDTWRELVAKYPALQKIYVTLEQSLHLSSLLNDFIASLGSRTTTIIRNSLWGLGEILLTLFIVFFLLRDGERFVDTLRELIPLSNDHTDRIIAKIDDTIHATLFGMGAVALLQGFLGGLLFWWLSIPGAIIWGIVMGLLALVPYLGAFIVWIPVAVFLGLKGDWSSALITVLWGTIVVGFSDNLVYPLLVGKRMHYHTLLVFLFLLGGIFVFGSAGVVLGPVLLAATDGLISEWRDRRDEVTDVEKVDA